MTMAALKWLSVCALALAAGAAQAEIYRCQQDNGKVAYQDTPCNTGVQRKIDGPASRPDVKPAPAEALAPWMEPPMPRAEPAARPAREALREAAREAVREAAPESPPARPRKACPSEHDIRKLEVEISSIMNRDKERLQIELRRQLQEAKARR
jgi:hypothetical protein